MKHLKTRRILSLIGKAFIFVMLVAMVITASVTITASAPEVVEYISADTVPAITIKETQPYTQQATTLSTESSTQQETTEVTEEVTQCEEITEFVEETQSTDQTYNYSEDTLLLAKVIYLEAGTCSSQCQWLVGSTAMNLADEHGSLADVAYNCNIFNVAYLIDSCAPSDESVSIAEQILSGDRDLQVRAFKTDSYHEWATPYTAIDNVYFSSY